MTTLNSPLITPPSARTEVVDDIASATRRGDKLHWGLTAIALALLASLLFAAARNPRFEWDLVAKYFTSGIVLKGLSMSIGLMLILLVFGFVLGALIGVARLSSFGPLRWFAWCYTWFFRAVPPLVQLLLWYNLAYLVPRITMGIPFGPELFSIDTNLLISPFVAAVLGLGLLEAAYMAEIIRAGLASVDKGQGEAAMAIGLTRRQAFFRITLPQAMRVILPPLGSQSIVLLKATSLVSIIGLSDLLHSVQSIYNRTLEVIPLLMVASLWYLIAVSVLSVLQIALERRFSRSYATQTPVKGAA